jgi:2-keto-3-deoxy-L-rhamnonate aldolase RhmA
MISHIARFREQLSSGRICLGVGVTFSDPAVTEALCDSVDFVWVDLEHNPMSIESMMGHLIAARAGGAPAIVRVPSRDVGWIKRVLDSGAEGIILPQAGSAKDVKSFVSACRYPPLGTRGYGPRRPSNYGRDGGVEYLQRANRELFVAAQIETVGALDDIEQIVGIKGLDSVVLGPQDLSGSMGFPGQPRHPEVQDAIRLVAEKAHEAGLTVGIGMGADVGHACEAVDLGINWIQCGNDFSYMNCFADRLFTDIREHLSDE